MSFTKHFKKIIPSSIKRKIRGVINIYKGFRLKYLKTEKVFTDIFRNNEWGDQDSISGPGSNLVQTEILRTHLQNLFNDLKVNSLLDIPCGDFHWMSNLNLKDINYIGADIVKTIIKQNNDKYKKNNINFIHLNLLKDNLPKTDMIFCRDCLVHFSYKDILLALKNICSTKSTYLLATIFTSYKSNSDILTGQWRPLNLIAKPFNLPNPILILNEGCTEGNGKYADKSLGLWHISAIAKSMKFK